jgi:hypothetical protein
MGRLAVNAVAVADSRRWLNFATVAQGPGRPQGDLVPLRRSELA